MLTRTQTPRRLTPSTALQGLIDLPWGASLFAPPRQGG